MLPYRCFATACDGRSDRCPRFAASARGVHRRRKVPNDPEAIVEGALRLFGHPTVRPETRAALTTFARRSLAGAAGSKATSYPPLVANAVRRLLAVSPDLLTA